MPDNKELKEEELKAVTGGSSEVIGPGLSKYVNDTTGQIIVHDSKTNTLYTFANSEEFEKSIFS